jgi:DNA-directed RNA polymerase subunit RPC12/RpoP
MGDSRERGRRKEKLIPYRCYGCSYRTRLTEREAERGMSCPQCHSARLFEVRRDTGKYRVVWLRSGIIRNAVLGVCLLGFGAMLLMVARSYLTNPRAGMLQARVIAYGIVMLIFGVVALIAALLGQSD